MIVTEGAMRELVIPFGESGYVALYRHELADGAVYVLAFRHQREAGYWFAGNMRSSHIDDPAATERCLAATGERAARERAQRLSKALARLPVMRATKEASGKPATSARASTTRCEAAVMKMTDGGFRLADNVQYATDTMASSVQSAPLSIRATPRASSAVLRCWRRCTRGC